MHKQNAFTLIEIIMVIVILGILVSVVIPRVIGPNERIKAAEGQNTLTALMGAQKNYFLENSAYAAAIANLDLVIPGSSYFGVPTVANNAAALATVTSTAGGYVLTIDSAGVITCVDGSVTCAEIKCVKGGNRCN